MTIITLRAVSSWNMDLVVSKMSLTKNAMFVWSDWNENIRHKLSQKNRKHCSKKCSHILSALSHYFKDKTKCNLNFLTFPRPTLGLSRFQFTHELRSGAHTQDTQVLHSKSNNDKYIPDVCDCASIPVVSLGKTLHPLWWRTLGEVCQ